MSKRNNNLKAAMKTMAVITVSTGLLRGEFVSINQDRDEAFHAFAA